MLCNICNQREATIHVTTIVGESMVRRDLCSECQGKVSPEDGEFEETQRHARCEYCGGQPCAGGTDFMALTLGVQKLKFMCMRCSTEYARFVGELLSQCVRPEQPEDQLVLIEQSRRQAEDHMRRWVEATR